MLKSMGSYLKKAYYRKCYYHYKSLNIFESITPHKDPKYYTKFVNKSYHTS